jgi:GNAT superfamily N-acetyltransferase
MLIRPHRREDADRIAEILADGWRDTYAAIVPAEYLAYQADRVRRRAEIAHWLDDFRDDEAIFVAEQDSKVVGFIHMCLGNKAGLGSAGYVNLLYIDKAAHGRGTGRKLMSAGARWLVETEPGPLVLSAFERNPHRAFYAALDGLEVKRVLNDIPGATVWSVLYRWDDPSVLVSSD